MLVPRNTLVLVPRNSVVFMPPYDFFATSGCCFYAPVLFFYNGQGKRAENPENLESPYGFVGYSVAQGDQAARSARVIACAQHASAGRLMAHCRAIACR